MLITYTPVSVLPADAKARLKQVAQTLLQTNEASQGYIVFEGKFLECGAVAAFINEGKRTQLNG